MDTNQIYGLVNDVASQTMGTSAVSAVDTETLVAMGDYVFASTTSTENFINTLVQRIAQTIVSYRAYTNQLSDLVKGDIEWGAILQKIKVKMPTAEESEAFDLVDGTSVDMYKISTPKATQKLFASRTPYVIKVTIQRNTLKEAFLSEGAMGAFLTAIYGEVKNKLELTIENLGRLCMCNFIANTKPAQVIDLVTLYNAKVSPSPTLTTAKAWYDEKFLRFAIGQINLHSMKMKTMSTLYNAESEERHTPFEAQKYAVLADFTTCMETQMQYGAFNRQFVSKVTNIDVPYWQGALTPTDIIIKNNEIDGTDVEIKNVVAMIYDTDALGTYRKEEDVLTTPINASGRYSNTFWHEMQLWFNDMSENGVIFTLN